MNFRSVLYIIGLLISTLGCMMTIPTLFDLFSNHNNWSIFASTGIIIFLMGITIILAFKNKNTKIGNRETFLLSVLSWIFLAGIAALPLYLSDINISYTDAFFEATSGITTTGSTILVNIENVSKGILIWRSILQWLGGIGIIVMAVAALPLLHMSGLQLFFSEQIEPNDKLKERVNNLAKTIIIIYSIFTLICAILLNISGMSLFDSICHSMTTIATGGYSTKNNSIGYFDNIWIEIIIIMGMIAASLPFIIYAKSISNIKAVFMDKQVKGFLFTLIISIFIIAIWLNLKLNVNFIESIRISAFNVISIITGTGYSTEDFSEWGSFAISMLFIFMLIGGCTGSTTGGIKIFRIQILWQVILQQIQKVIRPHQILKITYSKAVIDDKTTLSILAIIFLFIISIIIIAGLLYWMGLDLLTAFSAAATSIAVVGPGLSNEIGPLGNFSNLPNQAKWLLSAAMIIGRLEFLAVLILIMPSFWRK
ncbi:MAG: potassium transporter TrkH [Pelagibacterales bacterium]|mgnify:FL=1|nr:potassium transporter TrkH [Pelagibacterales bacterium]|tara:strand:- start:12688 stop:14130 length:1443 start_codon:yes stop_codon:yes gene_type:complete